MAEFLDSSMFTSIVGLAILIISLTLFAFLLNDRKGPAEGLSNAPADPGATGDAGVEPAVVTAIAAAVAEYRRTYS